MSGHAPSWRLLATRRFAPLFVTQALGAFNDNMFRSAMIFLVAFGPLRVDGGAAAMVGVLSGAVFTLPFFLFSALAGQLADGHDKARIARWVKLAEVAIMIAGGAALLDGSLAGMMAVVFAMGLHSTIFGPVKYAILPQHLGAEELIGGTALVEAATFLAILAGQLLGGLLAPPAAGALMLAAALIGLAASRFIPPAPPAGAAPRIEPNIARSTLRIVAHARGNRPLFAAILGITWFFALGTVLTQQFAPLVGALNGTPAVAALFVGLFSVGVAIGSLLVGRLLGGRVSSRHVALAALAVALGVLDLGLAIRSFAPATMPAGIAAFYALPGAMRTTIDLLVIAIAGGVYIVPLYALLQTLGDAAVRARDVAANNIVNAAGMVALLALAGGALGAGLGSAGLFILLGLVGLGVALGAHRLFRAHGTSTPTPL